MKQSLQYGPLDKEEVQQLAPIPAWAFGSAEADTVEWLQRAGTEKIRVLRENDSIVACLAGYEMGHWFGGESVSTTGIGLVAVAPEARGRGLAQHLMRSALQEIRDKGFALSTLYPATDALYRKAGYEHAGSRCLVKLAANRLPPFKRELPVRHLESGDKKAVRKFHREAARHTAGNLDRNDFIWQRIMKPLRGEVRGYCVEADGKLEGYLYAAQRPTSRLGCYDLMVTDMVATSGRAARSLLAFLATHSTLAQELKWFCGPADPLLELLPETVHSLTVHERWMLRIVDVERALHDRGYPRGLEAKLEFELIDPLFAENAGRWILVVSGGRGQVHRGGQAELKLDIRGLAALFSGFQTPHGLRLAGLLEGPENAMQTAGLVFAGPPPWMADMF